MIFTEEYLKAILTIELHYFHMSPSYRLAPQSYVDLRRLLSAKHKPLGEILQEADLISSSRIELALQAQTQYPHLRLGEILAMCNWLKPQTADFFAKDWFNLIKHEHREPLGYYLRQAALLNESQIERVLAEQRETGIRFGTVAVLQGFIKSTTLDFFLMNLFPNELNVSPFINMYSTNRKFPFDLDC